MTLKNFVDLNAIEKILVYGWRNHLKIAPLMRTQTITYGILEAGFHETIFFGFAKR